MLNNISKAKKSGGFLRITDQKRESPKTAKKIVQFFGSETMEVFEKDINRLTSVPTIAKKKSQGKSQADKAQQVNDQGVPGLFYALGKSGHD